MDRQLGVSLVPDWAPPWPEGLTLKKLPLPHAREKRRVGLLWRRSSPRIRLVQALLAEAKRYEIGRPARPAPQGRLNHPIPINAGPRDYPRVPACGQKIGRHCEQCRPRGE